MPQAARLNHVSTPLMLASRTGNLASGTPRLPKRFEFAHELVFRRAGGSNQRVQLLTGPAQRLQILLPRPLWRRNIDPKRLAVAHDRNRLRRLEVTGQVFAKLSNSHARCWHFT